MSIKGKSAIVTGGGGALGRVIVARFIQEGVKVACSYRGESNSSSLRELSNAGVVAVEADVTKEPDVVRLFDEAARSCGPVDIVVNTVGGFLSRKPLDEVTVDEWNRMMDINLRSTFLCTREALRRMRGRTYGRIINTSAMTGLFPTAGRAPYAISKAAVSLLTDIVGQETKGTGITVNAIAPSIIDTPANRQSMPDEDFRRWVKPENIAETVCYLCSDAAADVTGTTIRAFGGV